MNSFLYAFKQKTGDRKTNFGTALFYERVQAGFTLECNKNVEVVPLLPFICKNILEVEPPIGSVCLVSKDHIHDMKPEKQSGLYLAQWLVTGKWGVIGNLQYLSANGFQYYILVYAE